MSLQPEIIDSLYKRYGYRQEIKTENVRVYLYEQGRYYGADIVPLNNLSLTITECEEIKRKYSDGGYAVQIKKYESDESVGKELYRSFFSYDSTKRRIINNYNEFKATQKKLNGGYSYEYINSPFRINNESEEKLNLIDGIIAKFSIERPQLLIIEASAGYGKTCTAYEILKKLAEDSSCENPLMTVLSRNRGANIFRYILLDEIDREYPTLDSSLVTYEINTGRIPLIIDGFDELLKKSELVKNDKDKVFNEIETMLDTIGNLLKNKARIILTSRKTAIFAGEDFQKWLSKWNDTFDVTRFSIETPKIKNWLNSEKIDAIKQEQIPVEYIANPVLLTYLRNLDMNTFNSHISEPDTIIKKYFHSLHSREMIRQELKINPEDQYDIFKNVVKLMVKFDQSTQERNFFREIILDENRSILEKSIKLYPADKDVDWLSEKLLNHALLDRKGKDENEIGFINDFIFGTFIGEIMTESTVEEINANFSAYMVELGATAYIVQNKNNKHLLWDKIEELKEKFESVSLFNFDITLKSKLERNYTDTIFQSLNVVKIYFDGKFKISSSVFIGCKFRKCNFEANAFESISFIECFFDECKIAGLSTINDYPSCYTIKCTQSGCNILANHINIQEKEETSIEIEFENRVLKELYSIDKLYKFQRLLNLMKGFDKSEHRNIARAIDRLEKKRIVNVSGTDIFIEINKLNYVKQRIALI